MFLDHITFTHDNAAPEELSAFLAATDAGACALRGRL
jgi:hypothetical protein